MTKKKSKWMSVKEAAKVLRISEPTAYRYFKEGILKGERLIIGSRIRILRECVEDLQESIKEN